MALKKLREMLDSKEISAVELTEQYLDRIENSDKDKFVLLTLSHIRNLDSDPFASYTFT